MTPGDVIIYDKNTPWSMDIMATDGTKLSSMTAATQLEANDLMYAVDITEAAASQSKKSTIDIFFQSVVISNDAIMLVNDEIVML